MSHSKKKIHYAMPGLTVDTSPQNQDNSVRSSRSASPVRPPPYSPITPTLAAARLATSSNNGAQIANAPPPPQRQRQTYTHSQPAQTAIALPPPVPIAFDENPDALALKSAISILQMQARNATRDIQTLQRIKERAVGDPEGFKKAIQEGELKSTGDTLFKPSRVSAETSEDEDEDEDDEKEDRMDTDEQAGKKWERVPAPQTVVRCPPINWNQYAVVGESLDKLHKDQQARPSEGLPQRLGADGQLLFGGEGQRRSSDLGIAAPYTPGKDKVDKMGTRKGAKR